MKVYIFVERRHHGRGRLYAHVVLANSETRAWSELVQSMQSRFSDVQKLKFVVVGVSSNNRVSLEQSFGMMGYL